MTTSTNLDAIRAHVRAYVASNMLDAVSITRPDQPSMVLDPATGQLHAPPATVIYAGKARVHKASSTGNAGTGGGNIAQREVVISTPWDSPEAQVDDLVEITVQGDAALVETWWRVIGVSTGGIFVEANTYTCNAWDKSSYWSGNG